MLNRPSLFDALRGRALPLAGRRVAVSGASGSFGRALLRQLHQRGATLVALTSSTRPLELRDRDGSPIRCEQVVWQCGRETELAGVLSGVEILVLNHGINVHGACSLEATEASLEVNALSSWRLLELFAGLPTPAPGQREVWVNTSEAEIQPAVSPLYEISKRLLGQLVSLRSAELERRAQAPLRIRRLVLGPFRSALNPIGVMGADFVAAQVLAQASRNLGLIIVTPNPLTYVVMPLTTMGRSLYNRLFTRTAG
jgi:NAD(P)-dependent dehydrogenase (short-subunit alcohol dehydrogenase family)